MRKILTYLSVVMALGLLVNCGGGGSSNPVIGNEQQEVVKDYKGALGAGDIAEYKFNTDTNEFYYHIQGPVAGDVEGTTILTKIYGNYYRTDSNDVIFLSGNLAVAHVEINNTQSFIAAMSDLPTNINESDVVGEYNYIRFYNNSLKPTICKSKFDANHTLEVGPCIDNCNYSGQIKWKLVNGAVQLYDDFNSTNVIGYIRKGIDRKVAIFDIRKAENNDSKRGIAILVSSDKNLTTAEVGNHQYTHMDISSSGYSFGSATINGTFLSWKHLDSQTYQVDDEGNNTLTFNPTICSQTFKGIAKVNGTGQYGLFSGDDGFYFVINTDRNSTDQFIFGLGSNKPLP